MIRKNLASCYIAQILFSSLSPRSIALLDARRESLKCLDLIWQAYIVVLRFLLYLFNVSFYHGYYIFGIFFLFYSHTYSPRDTNAITLDRIARDARKYIGYRRGAQKAPMSANSIRYTESRIQSREHTRAPS